MNRVHVLDAIQRFEAEPDRGVTYRAQPLDATALEGAPSALTYGIPVIPFFYAWDGQASFPRTYSGSDRDELLAALPPARPTDGSTAPAWDPTARRWATTCSVRPSVNDVPGGVVGGHEQGVGLSWPGRDAALQQAEGSPEGELVMVGAGAAGSGAHEVLVGDNLDVLRSLKETLRPKLILIDPPYNTGRQFTYRDRFGAGSGRAAWLSFMAPRLAVSISMLPEDGFLAVFIDDTEVATLRLLLDELMGPANALATLVFDRNRKNDARYFSVGHEYLLVYAKNERALRESGVVLRADKPGVDEVRALFEALRSEHDDHWPTVQAALRKAYRAWPPDDPRRPLARFNRVDERGPHRVDGDLSWPGGGGPRYEVLHPTTGRPVRVPKRGWVYPTAERFWQAHAAGHVHFGIDETSAPSRRRDLFAAAEQVMSSVHYSYAQNAARELDELFDKKRVFDNPKPVPDLARLIHYLCGPSDVVLDFFAGSGATGHAVWEANHRHGTRRRFVLVQSAEPVNPRARTASAKNALAMGLSSIDAILCERLARASRRLREAGASGDLGFVIRRWTAST